MSVDELLTTAELAKVLKCSPRTLEQDRLKGKGVPFVKIGSSVRYRNTDVQAFIAGNVRQSTSQEVPA